MFHSVLLRVQIRGRGGTNPLADMDPGVQFEGGPNPLKHRPDQLVLKWNARIFRIGFGQNGSVHASKSLSSPASVDQSAGIW